MVLLYVCMYALIYILVALVLVWPSGFKMVECRLNCVCVLIVCISTYQLLSIRVASFPGSPHARTKNLHATESWVGPGNEASNRVLCM